MKRNDFLLIFSIVLIAGAGLLWNQFGKESNGGTATVYVDGESVAVYDLREDGEYVIDTEYGQNLLVIEAGKADITEADCPDELCVKQHSIHKTGETIVCLPHRVVVEIKGSLNNDLDAVAQ